MVALTEAALAIGTQCRECWEARVAWCAAVSAQGDAEMPAIDATNGISAIGNAVSNELA